MRGDAGGCKCPPSSLCFPRLTARGTELADEGRYFRRVRLESEVSRIDHVKLDVLEILAIRFRTRP